jgi:hypothetical protein
VNCSRTRIYCRILLLCSKKINGKKSVPIAIEPVPKISFASAVALLNQGITEVGHFLPTSTFFTYKYIFFTSILFSFNKKPRIHQIQTGEYERFGICECGGCQHWFRVGIGLGLGYRLGIGLGLGYRVGIGLGLGYWVDIGLGLGYRYLSGVVGVYQSRLFSTRWRRNIIGGGGLVVAGVGVL